MDDKEFDSAIANLLNEERKKEPYYLESIDTEIRAVSDAFYDHYVGLTSMSSIQTVDELLQDIEGKTAYDPDEEEIDPDAQDPMLVTLSELLQPDIEKHDIFAGSEIHVSGHGLYAYEPARLEEVDVEALDENGIGLLEDGESIIGDFERFAVGQVVTFGAYLQTMQDYESAEEVVEGDESDLEMPGVWLMLSDARVMDTNGNEQRKLPDVLIPISYQTLQFSRVIRRTNSEKIRQTDQEVTPDISVYFKGDFIMDTCNDIENDLNYNEYTEAELHARREYHQDQLSVYMSAVDQGELSITAFNAIFHNGDESELSDQAVQYLQPVVMKLEKTWRVVHAFGIYSDDGPRVAHILPEHLLHIAKKVQE